MDRQTVELASLGFQALVTTLLVALNLALWRQERRVYYLSWAVAWSCYAARLGCISAYLVFRSPVWLFLHQVATGATALLLLWASLQFSRGVRFQRRYLWTLGAVAGWAALSVFVFTDFRVGGITSAAALAAVTLWTGWVFRQHGRRSGSGGALLLAWTFLFWGLHHLDYPLLRAFGNGLLYGVFADVLFIVVAAAGMVFLGLMEGRVALETRNTQLQQLTHLLFSAQEDERRRIARELHDETGQLLTAVKIDLDLQGRTEAGARVGEALGKVRDMSNLLRPAALDDLGLVPALRSLIEDFAGRTRIETRFEAPDSPPVSDRAVEVAVYRLVQEALTNVARHARAARVRVALEREVDGVRIRVEDDGVGAEPSRAPHLGLLGMRERVRELAGTLTIQTGAGAGFRLEAAIPCRAAA